MCGTSVSMHINHSSSSGYKVICVLRLKNLAVLY
uniref:Uncharacterized protein n=1 Tax=Anguilla anguilla TaxID=7936 RepID=A0A0E9VSF5_ANGAN